MCHISTDQPNRLFALSNGKYCTVLIYHHKFVYRRNRNYDWYQHLALCIGGYDGGNYTFAKINYLNNGI